MKKILFFVLLFSFLTGCRFSDEPGARRVLKDSGYTDIKIESRWTGCSEDDGWVTGFRAKSVSGTIVTGVVCSGYWKGSTIRLD